MRRTFALLLALPAAPSAAQDMLVLDPVILSAGLTPLPADAYGRAHTVITAEEIARKGYATVQDALRAVPGVAVAAAGNSFGQVRIRGGEANHTLVLVDGVKAAGGADEYVFSGLETSTIERIEILRGPQSAIYGSNASAGVVNIITRTAAEGTRFGLQAEAGSGASIAAQASHRGARGGLSLQLFDRNDHAFDESGDGGEKDRLQRRGFVLNGDWQATEDLSFGATLRRAQEFYRHDTINYLATSAEDYIIDDTFPYSDRKEMTGAIWGEYAMLDGRATHRLQYEKSVFEQGYNGGPMTKGETRALKYRLSAGLDGAPAASARHLGSLLVEREEDSSSAAPDYARDMTSVAVEYRGRLGGGLDLQAGIRRDDNDRFADFTSFSLGLSWRIAGTPWRLHASGGRGSVNPSFYELFANDVYTEGNPDLKPERNSGYDIGVEYGFARGLLDVTYFDEELTDEIVYVPGGSGGRFTYQNQPGRSPRSGVEVTGRWEATPTLSLGLAYTYLDARNPDGSVETRRPRNELGLTATQQLWDGRASLTGEVRRITGSYDTEFWDYTSPVTRLPDATVVNVSGSYALSDTLRLTARIVNLFDEDYREVWGYATRGRTAYVGIAANW